MKILVVGKFDVDDFALHIAESLSDMGHAVRRFAPMPRVHPTGGRVSYRFHQMRQVVHSASANVPAVRARRMRALWRVADQGPLDLVIVCYDFLWPEEVKTLKQRTHAPVAMWFPDSIAGFGRAFFMNASYDALFFKDPYIVSKLKDLLKTPVFYLPESFNPKRHWLPESEIGNDPAYQCDLTFVGTPHSQRIALCKNLTDCDVKLWGGPPALWMDLGEVAHMYQGRPVFNHDKVRAFRGARIVINNLLYGEIWGVNVRTFEVAGAGGFQLIEWRAGLRQLFADGEEIVAYRGVADLNRKIAAYLQDAEGRKAIAAAGQRRAFTEHTYELRLKLLIETVMGVATGFPMLRQNLYDQWGYG